MSRLRAVVAALTLGAPFAATAADVTRVASSFEDDHPFGMFIDVGLEHTQRRTKILREVLPTGEGSRQYVGELLYKGFDTRLNVDLSLGIAQDVELSFGLPVVLFQDESWSFASDTNSTLLNNCLRANGSLTDPSCPAMGAGAVPLFNVPLETFRGGLGNMRFGLAWAVFNQRKDETKPTWVVGLDYEAPTAKLLGRAGRHR